MTTDAKQPPSRLARATYVAMAAFALATGISGLMYSKSTFPGVLCIFFGLIGLIGNLIMAAKEDGDDITKK